jgi:hypothetical protein
MKTNRTTKPNGNGLPVQTVPVEFAHQTATKVSIAGTFNGWRLAVTPMVSLGDGRRFTKLALPPGVYEYRLLVDGEWMPDPQACETAPNLFGGFNSVLKMEGSACR